MSGNWGGTVTFPDGSFAAAFALTQNGTSVSGGYADSGGSGAVSGSVSGTNTVRLNLTGYPDIPLLTFAGTVDADVNRWSGTITQFSGVTFTFTRR